MNNNSLAYVKEGKLGAAQICCLSWLNLILMSNTIVERPIKQPLLHFTVKLTQITPLPRETLIYSGIALKVVNKIQKDFKSKQFIVVGHQSDPNVFSIKPVIGGQIRKINR